MLSGVEAERGTWTLPHPIYESWEAMEEILTWSAKEPISQDRIWKGVYYDSEIDRSLHPRISIRKIDEEIGLGVFAEEPIPANQFVGEYTGLIRKKKRAHDGESVYSFSLNAWRMGKVPYVISSETMGNFTRFINHSDEPNAEAISVLWRGMPRVIFLSLKMIPKGGQILFDYGKIFWEEVPHLRKRPL